MIREKYTNRRTVLKKVGAAGSGAALVVASSNRGNAQRRDEYVGITYNPVTGERTGLADANIVATPNNMNGRIRLNESALSVSDVNIPINIQPDRTTTVAERHENVNENRGVGKFSVRKGNDFRRNNKDLVMRMTKNQNAALSGVAEHIQHTSEGTAFILEKSDQRSVSEIRESLTNHIEQISNNANEGGE